MKADNVSLLVLAGGLGSRFGGDKQLATIGMTGRTLLHFSVLDAYAAGVRHLVMVIRPNLLEAFNKQVLPHLPADVTVDLVCQQLELLPDDVTADFTARQKPWGTAHALWCALHCAAGALQQPFIVINADDYYGPRAMQLLVQHFNGPQAAQWAMVAYPLAATLSEHGGVNRGLCRVQQGLLQQRLLKQVIECTDIRAKGAGGPSATTQNPTGDAPFSGQLANGERVALQPTDLVSMNIWGFTPALLPLLDAQLRAFFQASPAATAECYLPAVVDVALQQGQALQVYCSGEPWRGVTYPADLPLVAQFFDNSR